MTFLLAVYRSTGIGQPPISDRNVTVTVNVVTGPRDKDSIRLEESIGPSHVSMRFLTNQVSCFCSVVPDLTCTRFKPSKHTRSSLGRSPT